MNAIVRNLTLSLAVGMLNSAVFCQEKAVAETKAAKYVIFSKPDDAQLGASLFRVLIGADKNVRFEKAESIEKAIESDANVIVVVATQKIPPGGQFHWNLDQKSLASLKNRKVIGIGYGASQLFEDMGLEINAGNCMYFRQIPNMVIVPNVLIDPASVSGPIEVLKDQILNGADPKVGMGVFAMLIPETSDEAKFVEAIARFKSDMNYSPIVRQGNYMLIGTPVNVTRWAKEYEHLIREICMNFHARHPEDFKVIERELAKPGKYTIDLAELNSTERPFSKDFHFRFDKPTKVTIRLTHPGRQAVMMMFRGGNGSDTKRLDTTDGAPLQIDVEVSAKDIQEAGGKYWVLDILNFGSEAVSCELDISSSE